MKKAIVSLLIKIRPFLTNQRLNEKVLLNQGKILEELYSKKQVENLSEYEWGVFSQWGEDGIIQFLIREVEIQNKTFIEFGVEDFFESNCRYLLMASDWQGFVIDGSDENIRRLQNSYFYWRHDLQSVAAFVDRENINELLNTTLLD